MSFSSRVGFRALFVVLISLFAANAFSQTVTGSISGTVKDSSGLVLPNAQVEIVNTDTGLARAVQSNAAGYYSAVLLPLGNYKVTATVQGFQTEARSGIQLTVGREAVVDLTMTVGATTQTVEVRGEAALINTTTATMQGLVSGEQIRELPLNGRSYNDLALLNPGVIYNSNTGSSASDGYGVRMSVNGSRANQNLFLMDGTVTNDTSQTAGTVNAGSLGVEGIREFTVLTHNYTAEFGRSAGGVVNAVTRSGTNDFHGSLYEFLRNNKVDARDFFQLGDTAAFRRNQFGGALGGRIKKDKIFFFSNYEGFRQSLAIPSSANVPNVQARQGKIPASSAASCPSVSGGTFTPGSSGGLGTCSFTVSPKIVPYLNLYPLPNQRDNGNGTGVWFFGFKQPIVEDYYMNRGDFNLTDKDTMYVRYVFDPSTRLRPTAHPYWSTEDAASNHFAQIGETHVFSPTAVNEFRFAFNRTDRHTAIGATNPAIESLLTPSLSFVPGQPLGRINFTDSAATGSTGGGLAVFGNLNATPTVNLQNVFETADTFTLVSGKQSFKFGFDLQRIQTNQVSAGGIRGSWAFGSPLSFLTAQPANLEATKIVGQTPNGFSVNNFGWRQWLPAWFVHDDWRVNSRLTLNIGLRHEFFTDLREVNGLSGALINLTDANSTVGVPYRSAKMNFAPRFGMAWDPTGSGKTSIRGGIGIYFNQVNQREAGPSDYRFSATYQLACNWSSATNPCANFPYVPANPLSLLSTTKTYSAVQQDLQTPTVIQYGLDIQRQLSSTMTLRVGYVGWNGYNMTRSSQWNAKLIDPATGRYDSAGALRPNPNFSNITLVSSDAKGNYNSLQAEFQKRLSAGLTFQVSYTFAKALATTDSTANRTIDNTGAGYLTMDPRDPQRDYGRSGFDQRNVLVVNAQYQVPLTSGLNKGITKAILGGWTAGGIWQFATGLPLNITDGFQRVANGDTIAPNRPDSTPGFSNDPTSGLTAGCGSGAIPAGQALRTPTRWYDPCAFTLQRAGTFGNLGRNTVSGPGTNIMNFSLGKNFAFTERIKLQFRAEFFNLFNKAQFGTPGLAAFSDTGQYNAGAGNITATTSNGLGGRLIQGGLKLTF